jgi:hypothetical protein
LSIITINNGITHGNDHVALGDGEVALAACLTRFNLERSITRKKFSRGGPIGGGGICAQDYRAQKREKRSEKGGEKGVANNHGANEEANLNKGLSSFQSLSMQYKPSS